jgi:hypothetical protein
MEKNDRIYVVIFLCSFSTLAYEVALTRIFSIALSYHFGFMIVSIAMLGIAASGTALSLYQKLRSPACVSYCTLLLGISITVSYLITNQIPFDPVKLSWSKAQLLYIVVYYLILSLPFFFTGLIIASTFSLWGQRAGLIYGADLFGAGAGSVAVLLCMSFAGPDKMVFILSSVALLAAFLAGGKIQKAVSISLISLNMAFLIIYPACAQLHISSYKGLPASLNYPGARHLKTYTSSYSRIDTFASPAARYAPGLSLKYLDALPEQTGLSVDGSELNAITPVSNKQSLGFLGYLPSALPYEIKQSAGYPAASADVLILDPKGGLQVLVAQYYRARTVCKVESNPDIVRIIRDEFGDFSGGIYQYNTWTGLGRSWLKSQNRMFDIIDMPLTGTAPAGSVGISEDYRFTEEAFREYLSHLKPDGILSISLFLLPPPRTELRILNTIMTSLETLGVKDPESHVMAIRSWGTMCMLVKRSPFTGKEIALLRKFSAERRFDLIFYPGITEQDTNVYLRMPSYDYPAVFKNLVNPETRVQSINEHVFDIAPVRDDAPFFHYYLKYENMMKIYRMAGSKWQYFIEEGYIIHAVFVQAALLGLLLVMAPAFSLSRRKNPLGFSQPLWFLLYFAFLGMGFMFVEVSFIHKVILLLGNPSYALATVIASILISSGAGSLISQKVQFFRSPFILPVLSFLIVAGGILFPSFSDLLMQYSLKVRIISVFFYLVPAGLLMGIPFPAGMRMLNEKNRAIIPWAWVVNGCFSVLAPVITILLAMSFGFRFVMWAGAGAYIAAFAVFLPLSKKQ